MKVHLLKDAEDECQVTEGLDKKQGTIFVLYNSFVC